MPRNKYRSGAGQSKPQATTLYCPDESIRESENVCVCKVWCAVYSVIIVNFHCCRHNHGRSLNELFSFCIAFEL